MLHLIESLFTNDIGIVAEFTKLGIEHYEIEISSKEYIDGLNFYTSSQGDLNLVD
jgi:hypothetical protein